MPEISRFYGIIIALYYNEHNPPHFHAKYGEFKAEIDITTIKRRPSQTSKSISAGMGR